MTPAPWTDAESFRHFYGLLTTDLPYWPVLFLVGILGAVCGALRRAGYL